MKTSHTLAILLAIFFMLACIFFVPQYYSNNLSGEAFSEGVALLKQEKFPEGLAKIRYSMEQVRTSKGKLDSAAAASLRAALLDASGASVQNLMQSPEALKVLHDYNIPLTCGQKQKIADGLLEVARNHAIHNNPGLEGQALYVASLWAQDCKPTAGKGKLFDALLDDFQKKTGLEFPDNSWFVKIRWGTGIVDEAYMVPVLTPEQYKKTAQPNTLSQLRETLDSLQFSLQQLIGGVSALTPSATPTSAKYSPAMPPPATSTAKIETEKPPQPATPARQTQPQKAETPKAATQSQLVSKIPPPPPPPPPKIPVVIPKDAVAASVLSDISKSGIDVKNVSFSGNKKTLEIYVTSESLGGNLGKEFRNIFKTAYQKAVINAGNSRVTNFFLVYKKKNGNLRFRWNVSVADYQRYINNEISGKQFVDSGSKEIYE